MGYIGAEPATSFETVRKDRFTSQTGTTVTLSHTVSSINDIVVWVNSVKQDYTNYSVSGTTLTLGGSLVSADIVEVAYIGRTFQTVAPDTNMVTNAMMADDSIDSAEIVDGSIDTAHIGDLQVTTAKIAADAIDGTKLADDAVNSEHYTDGSIDLAHMSSESVDEDNLHISNAGTNGQFLSKQSGNSGGLTWADAGGGVTQGSVWYIPSDVSASNSTTEVLTTWTESNGSGYQRLGTAPTHSSGVFTLPETGWYYFSLSFQSNESGSANDQFGVGIDHSANSGSSFGTIARSWGRHDHSYSPDNFVSVSCLTRIANTSTNKIRVCVFGADTGQFTIKGGTQDGDYGGTNLSIVRMADS